MFEQEQGISPVPLVVRADEGLLTLEPLAIGHEPQANDPQAPHHIPDSSKLSRLFFTCPMNWSATAPSMTRWSKPSVR